MNLYDQWKAEPVKKISPLNLHKVGTTMEQIIYGSIQRGRMVGKCKTIHMAQYTRLLAAYVI
jgi:hypothetical protein